ncbi:MAG TPA: hypothetical protein VM165_12220, partial [Planctomycetaceae bacterium]|nr:hypothetical protein [Planctomycetaceae bacterium]
MRSFFATTLLLALAATVAGCATTENGQRFAGRPFWKNSAAKKNEDKKKASTESIAKSDNPFRKAADAAQSSDAAKGSGAKSAAGNDGDNRSQSETAETSAGDKAATEKSSKPGSFHPETMKLIDAELADASPDERAYWYDQLKRVDPAVIPQILQARRLTAQIVEQRQQESSTSDSMTEDNSRPFRDDALNRRTDNAAPSRPDPSIRQVSGRES